MATRRDAISSDPDPDHVYIERGNLTLRMANRRSRASPMRSS